MDHELTINAPVDVVWGVLTDFARYGEWNPFCVRCETTLRPGEPIVMAARLNPSSNATTEAREVVTEVVTGRFFAYRMKPFPLGGLRSRRTHTLTPQPDGRSTLYASHFELAGWLTSLVTCLHGPGLQAGFGAMAHALQRRCEEVAAGTAAAPRS